VDQVLYRKYRSASFDEVVGQDHIVASLTTAIQHGRLSHAYLFTGPRGTGKTSVARLLARSLNCTGEPKPCNQCANCRSALSSSLDIVEIDAASNRSIDSVRELKDKIALAPSAGKYKVYIIDEVHMLTTEAFNALLKTLEEPPAHAVFILATTEAHKLPDTIISRTQRFSFKPIALPGLTAHLSKIAAAEKIAVEPAALETIGRAARGSFRDAISLLDQLGSSADGAVTEGQVRDLLGYADPAAITAISRAIAGGDPKTALQLLTQLGDGGAQPAQVAAQLTEQWRSVLLAAANARPAADPDVQALAASVAPARAAQVIDVLLEVNRSHWPDLAIEAAVATLASLSTAPAPSAVPAPAPTPATKPAAAAPAPKANTMPSPTPDPASAPASPAAAGALESSLWPKVVVLIKGQNNSLSALLQMYPAEFSADVIVIKPRFNFHRDLFLKSANLKLIEAAAAKVYRRPVKVTARTDSPDAARTQPNPDPSAELISSALEILGGEVVE
jgi:DNA polymerase-3 subunit gamma/tau